MRHEFLAIWYSPTTTTTYTTKLTLLPSHLAFVFQTLGQGLDRYERDLGGAGSVAYLVLRRPPRFLGKEHCDVYVCLGVNIRPRLPEESLGLFFTLYRDVIDGLRPRRGVARTGAKIESSRWIKVKEGGGNNWR